MWWWLTLRVESATIRCLMPISSSQKSVGLVEIRWQQICPMALHDYLGGMLLAYDAASSNEEARKQCGRIVSGLEKLGIIKAKVGFTLMLAFVLSSFFFLALIILCTRPQEVASARAEGDGIRTPAVDTFAPGSRIMALYDADKMWYAATIRKVTARGNFIVHFTEYGNEVGTLLNVYLPVSVCVLSGLVDLWFAAVSARSWRSL